MKRTLTQAGLALSAAAVFTFAPSAVWAMGHRTGPQETAGVQAQADASGLLAEANEKAKPPSSFDSPPKVGTKATCPVMGNVFTVTEKTTRSTYKGKHYVFCCPGCKPKFDADPEKYAK